LMFIAKEPGDPNEDRGIAEERSSGAR
jgi:hypothetical protein